MTGLSLSLGMSQPIWSDPGTSFTPILRLNSLEEGELEIEAGTDPLFVTLSGNTPYDGSYTIIPSALFNGPVNLVPPEISGAATVGSTLTVLPGLWIFDSASGTPEIRQDWFSDGTAIPGAGSGAYTVQTGDEGEPLTVVESASNLFGTTMATSMGVIPLS